jgi:hypothetical protein
VRIKVRPYGSSYEQLVVDISVLKLLNQEEEKTRRAVCSCSQLPKDHMRHMSFSGTAIHLITVTQITGVERTHMQHSARSPQLANLEQLLTTAHVSISNHFVAKGCAAVAFLAPGFGLVLAV